MTTTVGDTVLKGTVFVILSAFTILALSAAISIVASPSPPSVKSQDAAIVGNRVTVRPSTILCGNRGDASVVYLAGEMALRETYRVEQNYSKAADAYIAARKTAMREAYSCQWGGYPSIHYTVQQKEIDGTTVKYCLQPDGGSKCLWTIDTFGGSASIALL